MATTFADLEARVRGVESRVQRTEEDTTAIITTVVDTRDEIGVLRADVQWLVRTVEMLAQAQGITPPPLVGPDDDYPDAPENHDPKAGA